MLQALPSTVQPLCALYLQGVFLSASFLGAFLKHGCNQIMTGSPLQCAQSILVRDDRPEVQADYLQRVFGGQAQSLLLSRLSPLAQPLHARRCNLKLCQRRKTISARGQGSFLNRTMRSTLVAWHTQIEYSRWTVYTCWVQAISKLSSRLRH